MGASHFRGQVYDQVAVMRDSRLFLLTFFEHGSESNSVPAREFILRVVVVGRAVIKRCPHGTVLSQDLRRNRLYAQRGKLFREITFDSRNSKPAIKAYSSPLMEFDAERRGRNLSTGFHAASPGNLARLIHRLL